MEKVLSFLKELKINNDRDWFAEHKDEYEASKEKFEKLCTELILRISAFDPDFKNLGIKECVFRIYRDIRFSHDKTPYKTHFGAYMAYPNGRKSHRCGFYLHIEPGGNNFFGAGVWSPEPKILKALRKSIFYNYEEFDAIRNEPKFKKLFGNSFYEDNKLKKIPTGFPADFVDPEILKLKHYMVSHDFTDQQAADTKLIDALTELAKCVFPLNKFLNFTIDEMT